MAASDARLKHHEPHDDQQDQRVQASQPEKSTRSTADLMVLGPELVGQARDLGALSPGIDAQKRGDSHEDERQPNPKLGEVPLLGDGHEPDPYAHDHEDGWADESAPHPFDLIGETEDHGPVVGSA